MATSHREQLDIIMGCYSEYIVGLRSDGGLTKAMGDALSIPLRVTEEQNRYIKFLEDRIARLERAIATISTKENA